VIRALTLPLSLALAGCATAAPERVRPAASTADLAGIDSTVRAVYEVISGPAGQPRDFARMRSLFAPNALMRVITPRGVRGGTLEEYITRNAAILEREGFTERELGRRTEVYGNLATVWSAYDGRTATGSFHERGINSLQLVRVNGRWLVASILWQEETPQFPLPANLDGGR
jgi:hypothetical protein